MNLRIRRKNPIIHQIDGIKYFLTDKPNYDDSLFIKKFAKIVNQKFAKIKYTMPLIEFKNFGFSNMGTYENNILQINSLIDFKWDYNTYLFTLFHELGHFIWEKLLSETTKNLFLKYIQKYTKQLSTKALNNILQKYNDNEIKLNFH